MWIVWMEKWMNRCEWNFGPKTTQKERKKNKHRHCDRFSFCVKNSFIQNGRLVKVFHTKRKIGYYIYILLLLLLRSSCFLCVYAFCIFIYCLTSQLIIVKILWRENWETEKSPLWMGKEIVLIRSRELFTTFSSFF